MSKTKDELNEEIALLKELLADKDSISSEYKSYSDNFDRKLETQKQYINQIIEEKLLICEGKLKYKRLDYFNFLIFIAFCAALTYGYAHLICGN